MSSLLPVEPSRLDGASLLVHISEGQAIGTGAGWYHYSDILTLKGFTPRVSQCAVSASTKLCGGTCVWMDWLDPMWLNHGAVFCEVFAPPVIKLGPAGVCTTVQGALDALKPNPYIDTAWLPQRERVMRMLIEYVLNGNKVLQSELLKSHPWPLAAVIARMVPVTDERSKASDEFWGINIHSGKGENTMGRLLQDYRDQLIAMGQAVHRAVPGCVEAAAVKLLTTEATVTTDQQRCVVRISPGSMQHATAGVSVCLVVDTSGSMHPYLQTVKLMLRHLLTSDDILSGGDEITIVQFATDARAVDEGNATLGSFVDTARQNALLDFVNGLHADGYTNLSTGVIMGLEQLKKATEGNTRCLFILTDGQPHADPLLAASEPYSMALLRKVKETVDGSTVNVFPIGFQRDVDSAPLSNLAADYNGTFEYVLTIDEANSKCEHIIRRMKSIVTRNLTLQARAVGGKISDIATSCELHTSSEDTLCVSIADQYCGETPRDVLFTLTPHTGEEEVSITYTLGFEDVAQKNTQTLHATVTVPHAQLRLLPSEVFLDAVNGLRYIETMQTVKRMIDVGDEIPAAALPGRRRGMPILSCPHTESPGWSKCIELELVLGYLRCSPVCTKSLQANVLRSLTALKETPLEGVHVTRSLGSMRGGR